MNSSKYIYLRTFGQNNESGIDRCTWSTQKRIVLHFRKDWDGRNLHLECVWKKVLTYLFGVYYWCRKVKKSSL